MNSMIVLIISLVCFFLLLIGMITYFWISMKKHKDYYDKLGAYLRQEPCNDTKTVLRTLDINLNKMETNLIEETKNTISDLTILNSTIEQDSRFIKINKDKEEFANYQIEIENKLVELKKLYSLGLKHLSNKNIFKVKKNMFEITKIKYQINKISKTVEQRSKKYINEIEQIYKELWIYTKIARDIFKIMEQWKNNKNVDLKFKEHVEQKKTRIKDINNELSNAINKQKIKESKNKFKEYRKSLFEMYEFGNYFDKFVEFIFINAPKIEKEINLFFKKVQNLTNSDLNFLGIEKYFENYNNSILEAKKFFYEFNVIETKKSIRKFLEILLNLNITINNELKAYKFINDEKRNEQLNYFYNDVSFKFLKIKEECKDACAIDNVYFEWIQSDILKMEEILKNLRDLKIFIESEHNDHNISNISKQYKYKNFAFNIKSFNEIYYNIKNEIELFYADGLRPRLKLNRIKQLLLNINASLEDYNIILTPEEEEQKNKLEEQRWDIDYKLSKKLIEENQFISLVEEMQNNCAKYINIVGKKILIVKIYININEKYSYRRQNNLDFHNKIKNSEQQIINGNYLEGLKLMINAIKEGVS